MFSYTQAKGDVDGYTLGRPDNKSGHLDLDSHSLGIYATRVDNNGWYLDGVLMNSWLDGEAKSNRGIGADVDGTTLLASL
ncbi:autotransporter domain-containing protein, partial [Streptococcus pyogenes]